MKRRSRGFTIVDSMFGFMVLTVGTLAFCTSLPIVSRSHHMADEQTKAVQIAQWQIEQVRQVGFANLEFDRLYSLGLVDSMEPGGPMTFTRAPVVEAARFSPGALLRDGVGELEIVEISDSLRELRVTVKWTAPSGQHRSTRLQTIVGRDL